MENNYLIEQIITKLSIKYNLPKAAVRCIVESPFRVLAEQIRGGTMKGVNFKNLGKFAIREDLVKSLKDGTNKQLTYQELKAKEKRKFEGYKIKIKKMKDEISAGNSDF